MTTKVYLPFGYTTYYTYYYSVTSVLNILIWLFQLIISHGFFLLAPINTGFHARVAWRPVFIIDMNNGCMCVCVCLCVFGDIRHNKYMGGKILGDGEG